MCSTGQRVAGDAGVRLAELVEQSRRVHAELAALVGSDAVAGLPIASITAATTALLGSADRATAVATVLTGRVATVEGQVLVAGRYASPRRWLEVEARLSEPAAAAIVGRGRDLVDHFSAVAGDWLSGAVSGDAVRELTVGVRSALRSLPAADRAEARAAALETLLPLARVGTVTDVRRAVKHVRFVVDPDGVRQAALDAYDDQTLRVTRVGSMSVLTAHLSHDTAAAVTTVLEQIVDGWHRRGELAADDAQPAVDGASAPARRVARPRHDHLLALALGEAFGSLLDGAAIGTHHGVAPHVTLTVDLADLEAGLGGELLMPGHDEPVLLPTSAVRRILCDSSVTPVVVATAHTDGAAADRCADSMAGRLRTASREVLYVGRAHRTVPPRLRRALEVRDRHCAFPGCHRTVTRTQAHHVREWEHGGTTDLDNCVLLCVRHHHAVHEGGWRVVADPSCSPGSRDYWTFVPPDRPPLH
jgi:hypothetical protein